MFSVVDGLAHGVGDDVDDVKGAEQVPRHASIEAF
jgi:hypothetical protein